MFKEKEVYDEGIPILNVKFIKKIPDEKYNDPDDIDYGDLLEPAYGIVGMVENELFIDDYDTDLLNDFHIPIIIKKEDSMDDFLEYRDYFKEKDFNTIWSFLQNHDNIDYLIIDTL